MYSAIEQNIYQNLTTYKKFIMEAQIENSNLRLSSSLLKWFGIGTGLGLVASVTLGNVAVGMILGLSLSFWVAIICKNCINKAL